MQNTDNTAIEEFDEEAPLAESLVASPRNVNAIGQVTRLYVTKGGCYIRVINSAGPRAKNDYYFLSKNNSNFNALYSLALAAATNRYSLWIRTTSTISPSSIASVHYLVQDF